MIAQCADDVADFVGRKAARVALASILVASLSEARVRAAPSRSMVTVGVGLDSVESMSSMILLSSL